jgi:hypothetical protein
VGFDCAGEAGDGLHHLGGAYFVLFGDDGQAADSGGCLFPFGVHQFDALGQGFVALGESVEAFIYGHGFLQYI